MFFCWQTFNGIRKSWNIHSQIFYLHRRGLWAVVSPMMMGHLKKNGTDYTFWSRDHKCCPIFMFDDILDSGQQLSVFSGISVHF